MLNCVGLLKIFGGVHWWQMCKFDSFKYDRGMLTISWPCWSLRCFIKVFVQSNPFGLSASWCCVHSGKGHMRGGVRVSVLICLWLIETIVGVWHRPST